MCVRGGPLLTWFLLFGLLLLVFKNTYLAAPSLSCGGQDLVP